jgi:hypothetical protein
MFSKLKRNVAKHTIYLTFFSKAIRVCSTGQIGIALTSIKSAAVRLVEHLAPSTIARGKDERERGRGNWEVCNRKE